MIKDLTPRQEQILIFIKQEISQKGYPPTVREIGKAIGLSSSSTVHNHLAKLEQKGLIRRSSSKTRAIEVVGFNFLSGQERNREEIVDIPLVGHVAAGQPILAEENVENTFPIPLYFTGKDEVFMLKVKGESMIEAGILDGDYIIVRKQNIANNGEIVVALINDEATVKTFYQEKHCIRLQPENSYMKPIITNEVNILGKVVSLLRKM